MNSYKSSKAEFTFLELSDKFLKQYNLPSEPCPVRVSVLENFMSKKVLEFPTLADECINYCRQNPENLNKFATLLVRLCYLAGVNVGQAGNDQMAQIYFSQAYCVAPSDTQVASNYALALSNNGYFDESLEVYEQILSNLQDGRLGFSAQIWTETVKIHYMKGNYQRALELVEISIKEAPQCFGEDAKAYAEELRNKIMSK